ncbi:DNA-binding protein [Rhodococcus sp. IEGM 1302]|uniref:helix-turn-helix transcriptional regulator n=1 Tax=Rhodococcus sp. IEGM 1302 TaxID=3047093 RepID=UPI0024B68D16|nr:DNA-binding protein [Rhodococcus sp. IEGM 1302]MDI9947415.1 DNA-binding protein [Rhodococcus sp. IEGM 1302]
MPENHCQNQVLTPLDVEAEFRIPRSTQKKQRALDTFAPHFRIGRRVYYRRSALVAWIAKQEQQTAGDHRG